MNFESVEASIEEIEENEEDARSSPYAILESWHQKVHPWEAYIATDRDWSLPAERIWSKRGPSAVLKKFPEHLAMGQWATAIAHTFEYATEPFLQLEKLLEDSKWILRLEAGWDDSAGVVFEQATWERATDCLRALARTTLVVFGETMPLPKIGPVNDGSIDLFWNVEGRNLLINVPPAAVATFDGRRPDGGSITGTLARFRAVGHLSAWLLKR